MALLAVVFSLSTVANVRAETIEDQVLNDPGPVYNTYAWELNNGSLSSGGFYITGDALQDSVFPFFSEADGFNNTFTYPTTVDTGTVAGTQNVTDIIDPVFSNDNPGVLAINIDPSQVSNDFLVVQIDEGYNNALAQNMQPLYESTKFLGEGEVGSTGEYWFAFAGFHPGTIIGGLIESGTGDIKVFGVVPAPESFWGGMALMTAVGVGMRIRKFRQFGASV